MSRFAVRLLVPVLLVTAAAQAEQLIEPGQWKVTSSTRGQWRRFGAAGQDVRCISAEQSADVARTFGPVSGTINSSCEDPKVETGGRTLQWRLQCRGQLDMDVAARFDFDTPRHYTATIVSKGHMAGVLISEVTTKLQGERAGACPQ